MIVVATYPEFNPRRYGNPWVALVDKKGNLDFTEKVGKYTGAFNKGEAGQLYITDPMEGQIYAYGQKDKRKNNGRYKYIQFIGGSLVPVKKDELVDLLKESF